MPRPPRYAPPGIPQHVIQRGNDRQACFVGEADYAVYIARLDEAAREHCVDIHAWVLMTNHVHLLVTPRRLDGLSKMMQCLGRNYVGWFNQCHERTGTLWEGRFRSCLVDADEYLLRCYRYIELNPVRAGIVADPADYPWSSFRCNALGRYSRLIVPHELYLSLGRTPALRMATYRELFNVALEPENLHAIRRAIKSGRVLGRDCFREECEARSGRSLQPGPRGRPRSGNKELVSNSVQKAESDPT